MNQENDKPLDYPLLALDAKRAAAACGMKIALWYQLSARGATPKPLKLNSKTIWSVDQLRLWLNHGSPSRDSATWLQLLEKMRGATMPNKGFIAYESRAFQKKS